MPVSHYFNNYSGNKINEQKLLEDMIVESIKVMGMDVYYIPRDSWTNDDIILGENPENKFTRAYTVDMYMQNFQGWEGQKDIFSKFGLEIRENSTFIVARRTFERCVPANIATRPREGDLIYIPMVQSIVEIKFVEQEANFHQIGSRGSLIYELSCELFRYSNENLDTGVEEIDDVERDMAYTIMLDVNTGSGHYNIGEVVYQGDNLTFATATAEVANWTPNDLKIYLYNIKGTFSAGANLIGYSSGTIYNVGTTDILGDYESADMRDNKEIEITSNTLIDTTETNPFGMP